MYHKEQSWESANIGIDQKMNLAALTVTFSQRGMSLLDFLAGNRGLSRNRAKALIDTRNVFVNRRRVWMARHQLEAGDSVEIGETVESKQMATRLPILFQDSNYIVVDKPAGTISNGPDSAESILKEQINMPSIAAVHRLDRDTGGCLLFAKTKEALDAAISLFRKHDMKKTYHVIVIGEMRSKERTISLPVDGQRAVTRLKALDSNRSASHLLATIETGRMHQIRKHLASIGNPVLGDSHYGPQTEATRKTMSVARQMLHASSLEFTCPLSRRRIRVIAPLPPDFRRCLAVFKLN
jgi:23S rRNA pseudouridine1911/1915/1917 synthase